MGLESSHAALKVTSELEISEVTSLMRHNKKNRMTIMRVVKRCKRSKIKEKTNDIL